MAERLTAIVGPMFATKTETLISQLHRAGVAGMQIQTFKHIIDDRYPHGTSHLESKSGLIYPTQAVRSAREIWELVDAGTNLVAVDEAQFFDPDILPVVDDFIHRGIRVFVSGLPTDFRNEGFGAMPELFARADHRISLDAVCKINGSGHVCEIPATHTQRLTNGQPSGYGEPVVVVGAEEMYEARCHKHYQIP